MAFMGGTLSPIDHVSKALLPTDRSRVAIAAGRASAQAVPAFLRDEGNHRQASHRIRPPPPQDGIEQEAGKEDGREIGAESCLPGFGRESATSPRECDPPLG